MTGITKVGTTSTILGQGCTFQLSAGMLPDRMITWGELATHATTQDCWILLGTAGIVWDETWLTLEYLTRNSRHAHLAFVNAQTMAMASKFLVLAGITRVCILRMLTTEACFCSGHGLFAQAHRWCGQCRHPLWR